MGSKAEFVDIVRDLCKAKGISINKLENELGFSNGSLLKATPNSIRLYSVAKYLGVRMETLLGEELIIVDSPQTSDDHYKYITVVDNSMYPLLQNGDILKIELTKDVYPQDLVAVKNSDDSICIRRFDIVENGIWLKVENKDADNDQFFTVRDLLSSSVNIIGRAVELQRQL